MIEDGANRNLIRVLLLFVGANESLCGAEAGEQVVDARSDDEFIIQTICGGGLSVNDGEIEIDDLSCFTTNFASEETKKRTTLTVFFELLSNGLCHEFGGEDGNGVGFLVWRESLGAFIHCCQVNSQVGDAEDGLLDVDETRSQGLVFFLGLDDDATSNSQITVEPGVEKNTTVELNTKTDVIALVELAAGFESKVRRVGVSTRKEAASTSLVLATDGESDNGGLVTCHVVAAVGFTEIVEFSFANLFVASNFEHL